MATVRVREVESLVNRLLSVADRLRAAAKCPTLDLKREYRPEARALAAAIQEVCEELDAATFEPPRPYGVEYLEATYAT